MRKWFASMLLGSTVLFVAAQAQAVTSVNLDFNGSGNTLAATGFDGVYTLNSSGFSVGGGRLTMQTLNGDTFGQYETDPDSAQNMFYSNIDAQGATTLEGRVRVSGLNSNFHGGGIWMGTDQDHYIRLGLFNNSFIGGVAWKRCARTRIAGAAPSRRGPVMTSSAERSTTCRPRRRPCRSTPCYDSSAPAARCRHSRAWTTA